MFRKSVVALVLISSTLFASDPEIVWVRMEVNRTYQDADANCYGASAIGQVLFSAEVQDGKVKKAFLQNYVKAWPYTAIHSEIALSDFEIKSIKFYQDSRGEQWLTHISLSEPSLRWVVYESGRRYSFCPLPKPIQTVSPNAATFVFETDGLEDEIWVSRSNKLSVSGHRKDDKAYKGSIQFVQKEFGDGL